MKNLSSGEFSDLSAGECLREERNRLGLKQEEMAEIGGVTRNTQGSYERNERRPDTGYLKALHSIGLDVLYVVTGIRSAPTVTGISGSEATLLARLRALPPHDQETVLRMVDALGAVAERDKK
ncbi:Regulatory protein [Pseudomonas syringae pv. spinaceae]|uniref:Regulatory protein n=1 Tax=Pseudomonas syringae pv. spinaceae TaxID=264459 RepID=A0A0Q0EJD3_PSESX|nr:MULTISPECIES: helix-turn-helix transcriptional regulator [Pseudomonas syringae group]KPZ10703.1 Regulatory protein [Pseudomonas syringae pv. spinaceae]QQN27112.1 helix-turn-helix transcriptional regulator [Pseudomonas syringae pv. maculicola]RMO77566.1 Regulatory protein [Pseudomonas syringae pv. maculicola]RMT26500.1 Regulatory protein [Pseudomonas syringae pv. spinaceae]